MNLGYIEIDTSISNEIFSKLVLFLDKEEVILDVKRIREKWFQKANIQEYLYEQEDCDDLFLKLFIEDGYTPKLDTDFNINDIKLGKQLNIKGIEYLKNLNQYFYEGLDSDKLSYFDRFLFDIEIMLHSYEKPSSFRIPLRHAILANKVFTNDYKVTEAIFIKEQNRLFPFSFGEMAIKFSPEARVENIMEEFIKCKESLLIEYSQYYKYPTYFNSRKSLANIRRDRNRYWQHYGSQKLSYEKIAELEGGLDSGVSAANIKESLLRYKKNLNR